MKYRDNIKEVLTPYEWRLRFANCVLEKMIEKGMTFKDLYHETHIWKGDLEKYLIGVLAPKPDDIGRIAIALGCKYNDLTGEPNIKIVLPDRHDN